MNRVGAVLLRRLAGNRSFVAVTSFTAPSSHRQQVRWKSRALRPYLSDLWSRKQFVDQTEPLRSEYPNWSQEAELAAFVARLGESVPLQEMQRLVSREGEPFELAAEGKTLAYTYANSYLRYHLPRLPEEGIQVIGDWVIDRTAEVASCLGFRDLQMMCAYEIEVSTLFMAFVQMVAAHSGADRAERFVLDFLLTELSGEDIMHLWYVSKPIEIMKDYFVKRDLPVPEPRLLRSTGSGTVLPVYIVGYFSDQRLLGQSPGENLFVAEEMAARDVLRGIFGARNMQFTFGRDMDEIQLTDDHRKSNWSLAALSDDTSFAVLPPLPEVLQVKDMYRKYMDETQAKFGIPYRRRLKNKFHGGTRFRVVIKRDIAPKLSTL